MDRATGCGWWFGGLVAVSGSLISMRCPHISHVFGLKDQPLKEQLRQPWTEMTIADGMNDHPMDGLGSRNPYRNLTWNAELCGCFLGLFAPYFVRNSWEGSPDDEVFVGLGEMVRLSNFDVRKQFWVEILRCLPWLFKVSLTFIYPSNWCSRKYSNSD